MKKRALDKLVTYRQTDRQTQISIPRAPVGAKKHQGLFLDKNIR